MHAIFAGVDEHEEEQMSTSMNVGRRFAITNLAKRPLVLSLNSKDTIHLAPGAKVAAIPEHEVTNNPDINKLRARALIDVAVQEAGDTDRGRGDKAKAPGRDK